MPEAVRYGFGGDQPQRNRATRRQQNVFGGKIEENAVASPGGIANPAKITVHGNLGSPALVAEIMRGSNCHKTATRFLKFQGNNTVPGPACLKLQHADSKLNTVFRPVICFTIGNIGDRVGIRTRGGEELHYTPDGGEPVPRASVGS